MLAGKLQPSFHTRFSTRGKKRKARPSVSLFYRPYRRGQDDGEDVKTKGDAMTTAVTASDVASKVEPEGLLFPRHARGFLYLHKPQPESGLPLSMSSIRFKCTPSLVHASSPYAAASMTHPESPFFLPPSLTSQEIYKAFKAGYDLSLPDRKPWAIPIVIVAARNSLRYLLREILEEGHFTQNELREFRSIYRNTENRRDAKDTPRNENLNRGNKPLRTLDSVFLIRIDDERYGVWVADVEDEQMDEQMASQGLAGQATLGWRGPHNNPVASLFSVAFGDQRAKYGGKEPYTGSCFPSHLVAAVILTLSLAIYVLK